MEAVATGLASGANAVKDYVRCTLLYQTLGKRMTYTIMDSALEELLKEELLYLKDDEAYNATRLGQAAVASAFSPEEGIFINEELSRALRAFVMDSDMHVLYLFTPLQVAASAQIDWLVFRDEIDNLNDNGIRAFQLVGVNPGAVNRTYALSCPGLFFFFFFFGQRNTDC